VLSYVNVNFICFSYACGLCACCICMMLVMIAVVSTYEVGGFVVVCVHHECMLVMHVSAYISLCIH